MHSSGGFCAHTSDQLILKGAGLPGMQAARWQPGRTWIFMNRHIGESSSWLAHPTCRRRCSPARWRSRGSPRRARVGPPGTALDPRFAGRGARRVGAACCFVPRCCECSCERVWNTSAAGRQLQGLCSRVQTCLHDASPRRVQTCLHDASPRRVQACPHEVPHPTQPPPPSHTP